MAYKFPGEGNKGGGQSGLSKEEMQKKKWEMKARQAKRQAEQKTSGKFPDSKTSTTSNASQHHIFKTYQPPPSMDGGYFCVKIQLGREAETYFQNNLSFSYLIPRREVVELAATAAAELVPEAFEQLLQMHVMIHAIETHYAQTNPDVPASYIKALEPQMGSVVGGPTHGREKMAVFVDHVVHTALGYNLSPKDRELWDKIRGSLE